MIQIFYPDYPSAFITDQRCLVALLLKKCVDSVLIEFMFLVSCKLQCTSLHNTQSYCQLWRAESLLYTHKTY